ncbi:uncharacterized protein LOC117894144 [Drosophila subobscura]|uniref:uncharacterized protein LOC117894144 n=1 Tax=Drosophila subobscura TaxID=7241 RepID=UPI00155A8D4F|nr:uncharacterized protein LOC117894144 [Drosophila subobscura]
MTPKMKKVVIKIPRHPYFNAQVNPENMVEYQLRKCRVNLERLKPLTTAGPFALQLKRCIVRVARLPDVERSEISVTPASSIINSDLDEEGAVDE